MFLCALVLYVIVNVASSQNVDLTVSAGAKGKDVVESVVDRIRTHCIFPDDRLFLRRLAYVESKDGMDSKTYRNGYHGGIWQVDEDKYEATHNCPYFNNQQCRIIKDVFNITWEETTWQDLRKPLYSGIAASLYMLVRFGFLKKMPGDLAGQAQTWSHYYHLNFPPSDFITAANAIDDDCSGQLDLAFIIDSSGSIRNQDFIHMLIFIQNITRELEFGPDATHYAAINFASISEVAFYFNSYNQKQDVIMAISNINKRDGGTRTYYAIDMAADQVFTSARGARNGIPKVVILLTDGASANMTRTVAAADRAKERGIIFITIGIGNINSQELEAVATDPACTHLFVLDDFSEIESLLFELRKTSCKAPAVINGHNNIGGNSTSVTDALTDGTITETIKVDEVGPGDVVKAEVTCGILDIYTSYDTPNPGPAFFDQRFTASDGTPAIISLVKNHEGRPLFITVIGTKLPSNPENFEQCQDARYKVSVAERPGSELEIVCRENGEERPCTREDYIHAELRPVICDDDNWRHIVSPCTVDNVNSGLLLHPHPFDSSLFIKCDLTGKMYITACPGQEIFNKETRSCGYDSVSAPSGGTSLPSHINNPCWAERIQRGEFFFPYPQDPHKFIHCDVWGGAWVQDCEPHSIWNDNAHTCVPDLLHEFEPSTQKPVHIHNPCEEGTTYLHPYPEDVTKFIHCDVSGNYWIQSCAPGMRFEPFVRVCV